MISPDRSKKMCKRNQKEYAAIANTLRLVDGKWHQSGQLRSITVCATNRSRAFLAAAREYRKMAKAGRCQVQRMLKPGSFSRPPRFGRAKCIIYVNVEEL
jgi:hypothetical protein